MTTPDTSTERVKCVVGHLRAYGFDIQIMDSCVGDILESLAAERDAAQDANEILRAEAERLRGALAEDCPNVLDNGDTPQPDAHEQEGRG